MRVVVSGGGTGGHIYPALAFMRYLEKQEDVEYLYIGTKRGLESKIVPQAGYAFDSIKIEGLKRSLSLENLKTAYYMVTSVIKARKILKEFKPDVVIGTGGYVCAPVLFAASLLKIPTIIHEQNSVAGVTNKFLAKWVNKIAICFEDVKKDFAYYSDKVVLTGNPRGQEVVEIKKNPEYLASIGVQTDLPIVVIFGGSRGSERMNEVFVEALEGFADKNYHVIMVTGEVHYDKINNQITKLEKSLPNVSVFPYIKDMPQLFQNVDLVVCRSGATTLTELTALGLASILIPSPYVTNNHQEANARSLVDQGAASMILEKELNAQTMLAEIDDILLDCHKKEAMAASAKKMGITDASSRLTSMIHEIM
ncbi:undecaprenyldiphospho-muramoylpentapeptide beta-N-acetylglucosaminyltransferase [Granulicatella elegans]|uniref:UDP-N-acetylglucosamine--N-acetylmuramyl-(pentapeptide) pyrophosphoryl-undecaprenol N-acetylglucosamine transferase n=1 Tax=Granulicatella elegans ATCC 700633 TaxID=626369 RepID=D0BLB9_9LACT|nr:undecaprenyldiphospho-muramoylpentapeptide beta-N-acetylglucosaminyltransferase [Granulicatella elegans]EEW93872.1 undecaprenyldiphospho-muramoylpentapeptide beta-N-acetylglucosaminyltransferase [Granulicatella elegans ATCC 700633]